MVYKYLVLLLYLPYILYQYHQKLSPLEIYNTLQNKIYGKETFTYINSIIAPYSGSIYPSIDLFTKDTCHCSIIEKKSLQNPFNCIHAIALANLGELTSGLIMIQYLQNSKQKGIITKITTQYYQKARGKIYSVSNLNYLKNGTIKSQLFNENGDLVCDVLCTWEIK